MRNKATFDELYIATQENLASVYNEIKDYDLATVSLQEALRCRTEKDPEKKDIKIA